MFRELCQSLSTNIGRPIYRAMFAYIANDDWADVVAEEGLPLKDRVAVALRFLDDDQVFSPHTYFGRQWNDTNLASVVVAADSVASGNDRESSEAG